MLRQHGHDVSALRAKTVAEVRGAEAPALDVRHAYAAIRRRIENCVALPLETLDAMSLQRRLDAIGTGGEVRLAIDTVTVGAPEAGS